MAKGRIAVKPSDLTNQLTRASAAIVGEPNWPPNAPSHAEVDTALAAMTGSISSINDLEAQLGQTRAALHTQTAAAIALMKRVDSATDMLYGPGGAHKAYFGLRPKKTTHEKRPALQQIIILRMADGIAPKSLFVDWEADPNAAAYQIEWFTDSDLTHRIGSAAVSESQYTITNLTTGQLYWVRVCGIRASETGPWSDPATRVANI